MKSSTEKLFNNFMKKRKQFISKINFLSDYLKSKAITPSDDNLYCVVRPRFVTFKKKRNSLRVDKFLRLFRRKTIHHDGKCLIHLCHNFYVFHRY